MIQLQLKYSQNCQGSKFRKLKFVTELEMAFAEATVTLRALREQNRGQAWNKLENRAIYAVILNILAS